MSHTNPKFWWIQSKVKLVLLILPDHESNNQHVHESLMAVQTVYAYWERL